MGHSLLDPHGQPESREALEKDKQATRIIFSTLFVWEKRPQRQSHNNVAPPSPERGTVRSDGLRALFR